MTGKGKIREIQIKNKIFIEQQFLFILFKQHILSLQGIKIKDRDGSYDEYISKSQLVESICELLNEYCGELPEGDSENESKC